MSDTTNLSATWMDSMFAAVAAKVIPAAPAGPSKQGDVAAVAKDQSQHPPLDPSAVALIDDLMQLGIRCTAINGTLKLTGKIVALTDDLRSRIASLKPAIINVLTAPPLFTWTVDRHVCPAGYDPAEWELVTWLTDLACSPALTSFDQLKTHDGSWLPLGRTIRDLLASLSSADDFARLGAFNAVREFRRTVDDQQGWRASSDAWPPCFDSDRRAADPQAIKSQPIDTSKITIAPPCMRPIILVRGPGHCAHWYVDREPIPPWAREHRVGCCDGWEPIPGEWFSKYGNEKQGDASA